MDLSLDYLPRLPRRKDVRIGCVGAGFIMRDCHLVAYCKAGFNPVAIASRTKENATRVAQRHGIVKVCDSYEQLLDDPSIEILDIAVPPNAQLGLIKAACARKTVKGILAQILNSNELNQKYQTPRDSLRKTWNNWLRLRRRKKIPELAAKDRDHNGL